MSRKPSRPLGDETSSSLFPFLSVLACVIGTLTLLIATIALGQIASDLADQVRIGEEEARLRASAAELQRLEASLESSAEQSAELEALRTRVAALTASQAAAAASASDDEALQERVDRTERRLAALREDDEQLDELVEDAAVDLDSLALPPDPELIKIQPSGSGAPLIPFFAECTSAGVKIRKPDGSWSLPLRVEGVIDGPRFRVFLEQVRRIRSGTVIFLLRPDGIATYERALRYAKTLAIRNGKLALPGDGELSFEDFPGPASEAAPRTGTNRAGPDA